MKKLLLVLLTAIFVLGACGNDSDKEGSETGVNEAEEKEILKVYEDLVAAYNKRDAEAVIETYGLAMKKDGFAEEIEEITQKYTELNVTVTVDEQKLLYKKDNEALIDVITSTRTPEFDPNSNWQNDRRVIHLLTKEEDQWKISTERVVKLTYLNEDGTLDTEYENFQGFDYSHYWDDKINELQQLDILPSEYLVQLEEETFANDAKELEEVVKKFDQFLNERDLEVWNSLFLFDEHKDDQEMMDVREEAKMT